MLKKFSVITTVTTALVVGGGLSSAEASSSYSANPSYTIHHVAKKENRITNFVQTSDDNTDHSFYFNGLNGNDQQNDDENDHVFDGKDNQVKQDQTQEQEQTKDNSKRDQQSKKQQEQDQSSKKNEEDNKQQESDKAGKQTEQKADGLSEYEQEVVDLTNKEREKQGLSPLQADTEISEVAHKKSDDMSTNNYFSHESPTYGSPFDMMDEFDVNYQTAGENIARGQQSPEKVVEGWMNSEGHRENILNEDFTHIGVGYVEDGNYWTQEFTG